jgi:hypothetical protein
LDRELRVCRDHDREPGVMVKKFCLAALALTMVGCALPHTRTYLPLTPLKPITESGYQVGEENRHDVRHVDLDAPQIKGPRLVEHWIELAFPFGMLRHSKWMTGPYPFTSDVWFPMGLPAGKGDRCGWQVYNGVKVEGGLLKEFKQNGWLTIPAEFHSKKECERKGITGCKPDEQNGWRFKCVDLDAVPEWMGTNMAGY